jgi:predicted lactoylglutathione lyase
MHESSVTLALPTDDRRRAHDFYVDVLLFEASGTELGSDGLPEPLQFAINAGLMLMFVPRGGFSRYVAGGRPVAEPPHTECLLSLPRATEAEVDEVVARAEAAGATVVTAPTRKPWAYEGTFADPDGHLWSVTTA